MFATEINLKLKTKPLCWSGEMAQYVKACAAKPDNLSSIPVTHTVERENQFLKSPDLYIRAVMLAYVCTYTSSKRMKG